MKCKTHYESGHDIQPTSQLAIGLSQRNSIMSDSTFDINFTPRFDNTLQAYQDVPVHQCSDCRHAAVFLFEPAASGMNE